MATCPTCHGAMLTEWPHLHHGRPIACYIDGCPNIASYVREDYPDDVRLCADHRHLRAEGE